MRLKQLFTRLSCAVLVFAATNVHAQSYNWKQVVIKGGGYVSGLVYSQADQSLLYARTDVGGAYRWDATNKRWIPITDALTDGNDWGMWSLAPDPVNADRVYIATGLYSQDWGAYGSVYRSDDRGASWTKLATLPCRLGGNNPGRGTGEHLAIDPNNNSILFLASKKDGMYKSTDGGVTWKTASEIGASYITFVEFDKTTGTKGNATQTLYAGVADYIYNGGKAGLYRSTDGGSSWNRVAGQPTAMPLKSFSPGNTAPTLIPTKMAFTSGNTIYVSAANSVVPDGEWELAAPHNTPSNGAVYKFDKSNSNAWTNISPANSTNLQGGFSSIAVSATDNNKIAITTIGRWWPHDELYVSPDGGATWSSTFNSFNYSSTWGASLNKGKMDYTKAPWGAAANIGWPTSIIINPKNSNEIMFGSGGGVYACYNTSGLYTNAGENNTAATSWVYENDGLEETCAIELISPPSGASLLSAIGDVDGFRHTDLDAVPNNRHLTNGVTVGTTRSIAFAENVPTKMVKAHDNNAQNKGAISTDGGVTWTKFASRPSGSADGDECGKISISADGKTIVWAPAKGAIAYSTNDGASWTNCNGDVPNGLRPVADRVNSSKFYVFDPATQIFYYSTDGGKNFSNKSLGLNNIPNYEGMQPQLCAVFGKEGHVLVADKGNGLHRSKDGGSTFTKITSVNTAYRVTVGKAAPTGSYPAIFIFGIINNVSGLFRSDDEGATWTRINDAEHEYARNHEFIAGDPRVYGRLYDAIGGRGIVYGDIAAVTCASLSLPTSTDLCQTGSATIDTKITDAAYTFTWKKDGTALTATTANIAVSDTGSYTVVAKKASCPDLTATSNVPSCTQSISLAAGWNLISFNLRPKDSSIATLFNGLNLKELKTMDAFWRKGQDAALNGIAKLSAGQGYLVNMNTAATLTLSGLPIVIRNSQFVINSGWNLIGCPYQTATPFTSLFTATNCAAIKNFDGFWIPNNTNSSIQNLEPGKGYFIK